MDRIKENEGGGRGVDMGPTGATLLKRIKEGGEEWIWVDLSTYIQ